MITPSSCGQMDALVKTGIVREKEPTDSEVPASSHTNSKLR